MTVDSIFKREDGTSYRVVVRGYLDTYNGNRLVYNVQVQYKERKKRKWLSIPLGISEYEYRGLSMEDRRKYDGLNVLRFVTKEEVYKAKLSFWEALKPTV